MRRNSIKYAAPALLASVLMSGALAFDFDLYMRWIKRNSGTTKNLTGICFGRDRYVAVGYDGTGNIILQSSDARVWFPSPAFTSGNLIGAAFGNNKFVVAASSGIWSSADANAWTHAAAPFAPDAVRFVNNRFFISGSGPRIISSADGATWSQFLSAQTGHSCRDIAFGKGVYVAVGRKSDNEIYIAASANSGGTWQEPALSVSGALRSTAFGNNIFVAVGGSDNQRGLIMTST